MINNKIKDFLKVSAISAMSIVSLILILCEIDADLRIIIVVKFIGFGLLWTTNGLYKRWYS